MKTTRLSTIARAIESAQATYAETLLEELDFSSDCVEGFAFNELAEEFSYSEIGEFREAAYA